MDAAVAAWRRGDLKAAESACRAVLAAGDGLEAWRLLGAVCFVGGRPREALEAFDAALRLSPEDAIAWAHHGTALGALGRATEALASFDRAVGLDPNDAGVWTNRGVALAALGRATEAVASQDRALALAPDHVEAIGARAAALAALGRTEEALVGYDRLIALRPGQAEAHDDRGVILARLGRLDEALAAHDRAIALKPAAAEPHNRRGLVLARMGRPDLAVEAYDRALAMAPDHALAWSNRGKALADQMRLDAALESLERALSLRPDLAEALANRGLLRLVQGDFVRGWGDYEHRWRAPDGPAIRHGDRPRWTGAEPLDGATLLLHAEQGYGDTLQFVRYAALAGRRGARVLVEAPPALAGLLSTLDAEVEVFAQDAPLPAFDLQCPLLSLPAAFATDEASIPWSGPYLRPDPERTRDWRARLGPDRRPRLGLAWSGNPAHNNDRNRSLPLADLLGALPPDMRLIRLQTETRAEDLAFLAARPDLALFAPKLGDFTETAALVQACDLIISVDTAVAHLAGALAKPVWILLPWAPDWRWGLGRKDCPWYPTARLYRQDAARDWRAPLLALRTDVRARFRRD
jgi:tetratricopeptide (TPR) repeat protein